MNIPSIQFIFDRKNKATGDKLGIIEMRITYQRIRKHLSTGIKCYPAQWDAKNELVKLSSNATEYNLILSEMKNRALRIVADMVKECKIDINVIPTLLKQKNVDITFLDYMYKRMKVRKVSEHTHRSYVTAYNKVYEFGKINFFSDITQKNLRDYSEWLHNYTWMEKDAYGRDVIRSYSQASIYKIMSNLSLFISDAVVDGYLTENPYVTKRMGENKGRTRIDEFLTADEVRMVEDANMPTKSLAEARDLFLLQCYTGLAYIDLMTYDFMKHKRGKLMDLCTGTRHKTGVEFHFVLTEKAMEILKKYNFTIPKLPNQKYNVKLKLVADAAGLDKPLTSHMGRRTAGSVWLNSGIPVEVVSKCLGHSSIAMTQRAYAKILDKTIVDAFEKAVIYKEKG